MHENRCIVCGEERSGLEVKKDSVIEGIRWFKRNITKNEKGYRLVVCKECYKTFRKARDSYVRKQILYLALGIVFAGFLVVFSSARLEALLIGFGITFFLYLLSLLSYMPEVIMPAKKQK